MPTIKTYTAQLGGVPSAAGRRASPDDFGAGVAEAVGGAARSAAGAANTLLQQREEAEARKTLVSTAQVKAKYATLLDEAANSGGDLEELREKMNEELSSIGDGFSTRRGQEQLDTSIANTNMMFQEQANAVQVRRAVTDARRQGAELIRSNTAIIQWNPDYLPVAEREAEAFGDTLKVRPEQRAEIVDSLKNQYHVAAALATARQQPEVIETHLQKQKWSLTPEQADAVRARADAELRGRRADAAYQRAETDRVAKEQNDEARDEYYGLIREGKLTWSMFANDPKLFAGTREHLANVMDKWAQDQVAPTRTDPSTFNGLRALIDLRQGDPRRIQDPETVWRYFGKGLSREDAILLEKRMRDNRTEAGQTWASAEAELLRNVKGQLDRSTLLTLDAGGGERMQRFSTHLRAKAEEYKAAGKDPYLLLRPNTPDYIGRDIPLFQTGAQRQQSDLVRDIDPALAPREPTTRRPLKDLFGQ